MLPPWSRGMAPTDPLSVVCFDAQAGERSLDGGPRLDPHDATL
jgi:hypothetical protein